MTPGQNHSYYLIQKQRIVELAWPPPPKSAEVSFKGRVLRLLHGGPRPGSPEQCVDPGDFESAVNVLDQQDIEAAISAFTRLGYQVTVRTLR
ncbi:hypothetical protein [Arthrobacter sp. UYCo732]|uniref:hypothetical protein n=1 Tax=Arthrobacter sp. UYCo732 TaxID=3156336 RepID=UPI0033953D8F